MRHGTHHRDRSRTGAPTAGHVDDYVDPDNPVRFIDAFVDSLDLSGAGFERAEPKETGRPGYDPADLPKLYIYGYLNRVRSSRQRQRPDCPGPRPRVLSPGVDSIWFQV